MPVIVPRLRQTFPVLATIAIQRRGAGWGAVIFLLAVITLQDLGATRPPQKTKSVFGLCEKGLDIAVGLLFAVDSIRKSPLYWREPKLAKNRIVCEFVSSLSVYPYRRIELVNFQKVGCRRYIRPLRLNVYTCYNSYEVKP